MELYRGDKNFFFFLKKKAEMQPQYFNFGLTSLNILSLVFVSIHELKLWRPAVALIDAPDVTKSRPFFFLQGLLTDLAP